MTPMLQKIVALLALARLSNAPTVLTNVLVGCALGGAALGLPTWLLAAAMVCFYAAGMILNDLCDLELDREHKPHRPLPAGHISAPTATLATTLLFAAGLALLLVFGVRTALCGAALVALVVVYDRWHRHAASALVMAATRAMVYVTAALAVAGTWPGAQLGVAAAMLASYVLGLTLVARSEAGLNPLRQWPVLFIVAPVGWLALTTAPTTWAWAVAALFAGWVALQLRKVFVVGQVGPAIGGLVAGIALFDAAVLMRLGLSNEALIALGAFAATRLGQRVIKGH